VVVVLQLFLVLISGPILVVVDLQLEWLLDEV
jgi:hypothetical protein